MTFGPPPPPPPSHQGYPPPGSYPPGQPAQQQRPRRSLRGLWITLAVVGVLCVGGVGTGGFFLFRTLLDVTEPPREATHAFLTDLQAENYDGAYDQLCDATQATFTRERFALVARDRGDVVDYQLTGAHVSRVNQDTTGTVTARLDLADGSTVTHEFRLVKSGDDWQVCGAPY
ncbi:hypothetical protein JQS43_13675 [Natronosporangium hydrolyticum]|uniref:DUF4878 domain-containing protein n=1 Tax=Natronosporangium hydrolyticum TaxID=2811111 RepID=A0A895YBA1_9ACTN|nr:DUF4878 domain-containing protein [Natronosporangium hydrolyticum]QSB12743.1 hypothetical protein JQS43_13675 [Natronosporangium hydrolyticum]